MMQGEPHAWKSELVCFHVIFYSWPQLNFRRKKIVCHAGFYRLFWKVHLITFSKFESNSHVAYSFPSTLWSIKSDNSKVMIYTGHLHVRYIYLKAYGIDFSGKIQYWRLPSNFIIMFHWSDYPFSLRLSSKLAWEEFTGTFVHSSNWVLFLGLILNLLLFGDFNFQESMESNYREVL